MKFSKEDHEKWVADKLLECLGLEAKYLRHGDERTEPDTIYELVSDSVLGIEIATAYYDNSDARQVWMVARGDRTFSASGYELRDGGVISNPDETMCRKIQAEVDEKTSKQYGGAEQIWLCIYEHAPLSDLASVTECTGGLVVPSGHSFAKIFILHHSPEHEGGCFKALEVSRGNRSILRYSQ